MGRTSKSFTLLLVIILAVSILIMAKPAFAQPIPVPTTPPPSTPEFSLKYIDHSYHANGNYVQNKSIEVIIKNQPTLWVLCYYVRSKSHLSEDWTYYGYYDNSTYVPNVLLAPNGRLIASNSSVTILVFGFEGNNSSNTNHLSLGKVNDGDQIDFQVQAYIGNWFPCKEINATASIEYNVVNIDAIGDWSPTQTVAISRSSSVPEFPTWIILPLFAVIILISMVFIRKRIPKKIAHFFICFYSRPFKGFNAIPTNEILLNVLST
jgi:hypothetical protein